MTKAMMINNEMLTEEQLDQVAGGSPIAAAAKVFGMIMDEIDSDEYAMLSDRYKGAVISRMFLQYGIGGALSTLSKVPVVGSKIADLSNTIQNCGENMSPATREKVETAIRTINGLIKRFA